MMAPRPTPQQAAAPQQNEAKRTSRRPKSTRIVIELTDGPRSTLEFGPVRGARVRVRGRDREDLAQVLQLLVDVAHWDRDLIPCMTGAMDWRWLNAELDAQDDDQVVAFPRRGR
jgi:hypothetical protein